jgi:hypothetical protein
VGKWFTRERDMEREVERIGREQTKRNQEERDRAS